MTVCCCVHVTQGHELQKSIKEHDELIRKLKEELAAAKERLRKESARNKGEVEQLEVINYSRIYFVFCVPFWIVTYGYMTNFSFVFTHTIHV